MNKLDELIQKHLPTIMMPAYQEKEELEAGKTRFLMGREGLYIETSQPWGHLIKQLWESSRPLPYGIVEEVDTFIDIILNEEVTKIIKKEIVPVAAQYAISDKEWMGWITWQDGVFEYVPLQINATENRVHYMTEALVDGHLAIDIHSHGRDKPFFSFTDDNDDKGGVRIAIVIGNYNETSENCRFEFKARYVVEGFHFAATIDNDEEEGKIEEFQEFIAL